MTHCIINNKIYITEEAMTCSPQCLKYPRWKINILRQFTGVLFITRAPALPTHNLIITSEHPVLKKYMLQKVLKINICIKLTTADDNVIVADSPNGRITRSAT